MKLKNKVFGTIFGVLASSLMFITVPTAANAGDCSPADPCETWAMIDGSGIVTNIIVCQPSVCGSGYFGNSRVVRQVAASSTGQNQGGWVNDEKNNTAVVHTNGTFTISNTTPVVSQHIEVEELTTTVVTTVIGETNARSFTYEDTQNKELNLAPEGQGIDYKEVAVSEGADGRVSIVYTDSQTVLMNISSEFTSRQTEEVVRNSLINKSQEISPSLIEEEKKLAIIEKNMPIIKRMMSRWLKDFLFM